jgi:hypothetical protein
LVMCSELFWRESAMVDLRVPLSKFLSCRLEAVLTVMTHSEEGCTTMWLLCLSFPSHLRLQWMTTGRF